MSPILNTAAPRIIGETRFSVVMYGGVSLAIYINGVAQELYRMVRSTAQDKNSSLMFPDDTLTGTERIYRKIARLLATPGLTDSPNALDDIGDGSPVKKLVVDIISGTSAGGINGIFLGKALSCGSDLSGIENLWIEQGDINVLLNDRQSLQPPLVAQHPPQSLLNSNRMYQELLKAFHGMEDKESGFVDRLDLFVTATDLAGMIVPVRLSDRVVMERAHKQVFHFKYRNNKKNNLEKPFNPFLAFAARCTSAFPFAFEPMCLGDIELITNRYPEYKGFIDKKIWDSIPMLKTDGAGGMNTAFSSRAFGDGGYLDNKPFGHVIDAMLHRSADVPVDRILLYIEPSPEHPEINKKTGVPCSVADAQVKPDAIANTLMAVSSLSRVETIREDIKRVVEHNRLVDRVYKILFGTEKDEGPVQAANSGKKLTKSQSVEEIREEIINSEKKWKELTLPDMIRNHTAGYTSYQRLEIAETTDFLASLITSLAGFSWESDLFVVTQGFVRAWRESCFVEKKDPLGSSNRLTLNAFLLNYGPSYPRRRIKFVIRKIQEKLKNPSAAGDDIFRDQCLRLHKELSGQYRKLVEVERELKSGGENGLLGDSVKAIVDEIVDEVKKSDSLDDVQPRDIVKHFLEKRNPGEKAERTCVKNAKDLLALNPSLLKSIEDFSERVMKSLEPVRWNVTSNCIHLLSTASENNSIDPDFWNGLLKAYVRYHDYDRFLFPVLYKTEFGEADIIEVLRVSPEDAVAILDEKSTKCRKLAGASLGNFGAFMSEEWRRNDILWGRLDGVERIISALLPDHEEIRNTLIKEAHCEILKEAMNNRDCEKVVRRLTSPWLRPSDKNDRLKGISKSDRKTGFKNYLGKINGLLGVTGQNPKDLNNVIQKVQGDYSDHFEQRAALNPETTLRILSRATAIVGKMLDGIYNEYKIVRKGAAWLVGLASMLSGLIEAAIPDNIFHFVIRHWLKVIYLAEIVCIAAGVFFSMNPLRDAGLIFFGLTFLSQVLLALFSDFLASKKGIFSALKAVLVTIVLICTISGAASLFALSGRANVIWKMMGTIRDASSSISTTQFFVTVIIALSCFIMFWIIFRIMVWVYWKVKLFLKKIA